MIQKARVYLAPYDQECIPLVNPLVEANVDDIQHRNPVHLRDQIVQRLQAVDAQIESLHRERETLRNDLAVTDQFLSVWRRSFNVQGPPERMETTMYPVSSDVTMPARKRKNPPRDYVVTEALKIIDERGAPASRSELYDALRERGIEVFGKDPVMVLSTMLWRSDDRIVRLKNHGYWPKDRTYEPAVYYPDLEDMLGAADTGPEDGVIEDGDDDVEVTSREG